MKYRIFVAALAFAVAFNVSGQGAVITDSSTFFYEVLDTDNATPLCSSALGTCGAYDAGVRWEFHDGSGQPAFDPQSGAFSVWILSTFVADNFLETNSVRFTYRRSLEFDGTYVAGALGDPPQTTSYTYSFFSDPDGPRGLYDTNGWNSLFPLVRTGIGEAFADFTPTPGVPFRVNFGVSVNQSFILVPAVGGPTTLQASDHIAISAFLADPPLNAREVPEPHATSMSLVGLSVLLAWIYATRANPACVDPG